MGKIEEAENRLYRNVFVCRNCNAKMRASPQKVMMKLIKCRKCGARNLRPKKRERRII